MACLLDTSALIEVFRGSRAGAEIKRAAGTDFKISEVTCYELSRKRPELDGRLSVLDRLPFDESARKRASELYQQLKRRGITIGELDILLAGTAISRSMTLLSLDKDFSLAGVPCRIFRAE